jgi:UDP-N-acetylglucosamine 2-epimerase (hydrolysing)
MRKLLFVTGTRADYGKLKSIIRLCEVQPDLETHVFVSGMHLLDEHGSTKNEIIHDAYRNIHIPESLRLTDQMDLNLANTIKAISECVKEIKPQLIVVHGDRIDPMAAALVGVLNNIKVAHIEGGEISGTVDEMLRHSISKLSHLHFVANEESRLRLLQLGESSSSIFVIGSPDIDIMLSDDLPGLTDVKRKYNIDFAEYAICIYHPVTTSGSIAGDIQQVLQALVQSRLNYLVLYPNNDFGSAIIKQELAKLKPNRHIALHSHFQFEDFLTLLKHADFIIGNSSAGVREACVYGVPSIDIGSRQSGRYSVNALRNIQHADEDRDNMLECIRMASHYRNKSLYFGDGKSAEKFVEVVWKEDVCDFNAQKTFVDLGSTVEAIQNYINEVCF